MKNMMKAGALLSALLASGAAQATCNADITITKPDTIYTNHGNGTVTDKQTGLMWMQCSQGRSGAACATGSNTTMNWKQAHEVAQTANGGAGTFGYTDWRLPTVAELRTLVELACYTPAINATVFPQTESSFYWSASPHRTNGGAAWVVGFNLGNEGLSNKNTNTYVHLVRGGD